MNRFLLLLLVTKILHGQEPVPQSSPSRGQVSLPLADWQAVWETASTLVSEKPTPPPVPPPVRAAIQSISYTAKLHGDVLQGEAIVSLRSFTSDWQVLPLVGGEWSLEPSAAQDGIALIRQEDCIAALLHGEGAFEIRLPLSLTLLDGRAKFSVMPAAAQRFTLSELPTGKMLMFDGAAPQPGNGWCSLPAKGGVVSLSLEAPKPPTPPPQPSTWAADSQIVAQFRDGEFRYQARLYLRTAQGSGLEATLYLPANAQVDEVMGEDFDSWRSQRSSDGLQRQITVRWKTGDRLDRRLEVHYTVPQSPVAVQWSLVAPQADEKGHSVFALVPLEGMEFSHATLQKVPSSRVLPWIKEATGGVSELLLVEGDAPVSVSAKSLPRVEAARATVSLQRAQTRLVADGSVLHEMRYEFKHNGPLTWAFDLPNATTLLACKVNDADARPVQRTERQLEFALPAKGDGSTTSTVMLTWHFKGGAWDKVSGQFALDLPKTDLFTQDLQWQIELPEGYDLAAAEGLDRANVPHTSDRMVAFQKQLFTNEAPGIELFYQRTEITE